MTVFDPRRYWEDRLSQELDLASVGYLGLGRHFNRWTYVVRRRAFLAAVKRGVGPLKPSDPVLDIGSGSGFYLDLWREHGARKLTAVELTAAATDRLRDRFPDVEVRRADVAASEADIPGGPFAVISAMDVFFHIVDDAGHRRALRTLAKLLRPGGLLVFTDNFVRDGERRQSHHVSRNTEHLHAALAEAGLEPVLRRPVFFLMNAPVASRSRLLAAWWWLAERVIAQHEMLGQVAGALFAGPEILLGGVMRRGPSTEVMVCRATGGATSDT